MALELGLALTLHASSSCAVDAATCLDEEINFSSLAWPCTMALAASHRLWVAMATRRAYNHTTQASSATYVLWQRGTARIRPLLLQQSIDISCQPGPQQQTCNVCWDRQRTDRQTPTHGWRRGAVVSGFRRMNEVNARRAQLVPGWVTGYTISVCNKPTRSTQPCIPPGSLNRVPASAGVRAGMSPLPGGR